MGNRTERALNSISFEEDRVGREAATGRAAEAERSTGGSAENAWTSLVQQSKRAAMMIERRMAAAVQDFNSQAA